METIKLKLIWMGTGWQCESSDVEGIVGKGFDRSEAIQDYLTAFETKFNYLPKWL